jgi:hypothetical protein
MVWMTLGQIAETFLLPFHNETEAIGQPAGTLNRNENRA